MSVVKHKKTLKYKERTCGGVLRRVAAVTTVTIDGVVPVWQQRHDEPARRIARYRSQDMIVGAAHQRVGHHVGHGRRAIIVHHTGSEM